LQNVYTNNTIDIKEKKTGQLKKIEYDYLVICTGAQYNEPVRTENILAKDERSNYIKN
jgi:NADH dehydrogenase FAD-containing subunit